MSSIKRGITIGVPFTGRKLVPEWGWTFAQLRWPMNCDLVFERVEDTEIGAAREELAERARLHGTHYLFFLDEDVAPPLNAVKLLLEAMDARPDAVIIGGIYTDKNDPTQPMVFNEPGNGPYWDWEYGKCFKLGFGVATGCSLINVELLDRIPRRWFQTVETDRERWTEDMWFCKQAREAGFSVYAHGGVLCRHFDLTTGKSYSLSSNSKPFRNFKGDFHV